MRTITTYQCEVCGSIYKESEIAALCEAHVPDPCLVTVSDMVLVCHCEGEPELDTVVGIRIGPGHLPSHANGWALDTLKAFLDLYPDWTWHGWIVETQGYHQVYKGWGGYTKSIPLVYIADVIKHEKGPEST